MQAIAVLPAFRWQGFGTQLMTQICQFCYDNYQLSTDLKQFCEKLGWRQLLAEFFVKNGESEVRMAEEDDGLMLLPEMNCGTNELRRCTCKPRIGDDW